MTHCPHCQAVLPEEGIVFCGGCGRRVEGWSKTPHAAKRATEALPHDELPDGAAPTRKGEVDSALRRVLKANIGAPSGKAKDGAAAGGATERLAPPSSAAETQNLSPPPRPTTAERGAADSSGAELGLSAEMQAVAARGPRLVQLTALALFVAIGAAGLAFATARLFRKPVEHKPVVVSLDATPTASVAATGAAGPPGSLGAGGRGRRRRGALAGATGAPNAPTAAAAPTASPTAAADPATAAPAASTAPAAPGTTDPTAASAPVAAAAPSASAPSAPAPASTHHGKSTAAAAPPVSAMPTDGDETAPPTEQELAEEQQAAQYAEGIRFVARSHRALVENCYERAFKTEPSSPGGRVEVGFTIDKEGRAKRVATLTNSTGNERVAQCIEQLVAGWQFPRPPSGEFAASYPFVFSGG